MDSKNRLFSVNAILDEGLSYLTETRVVLLFKHYVPLLFSRPYLIDRTPSSVCLFVCNGCIMAKL